jgi:hypothetical protein
LRPTPSRVSAARCRRSSAFSCQYRASFVLFHITSVGSSMYGAVPAPGGQFVLSLGGGASTVFVVDRPQGRHCRTNVCWLGARRIVASGRIGRPQTGHARSLSLSSIAATPRQHGATVHNGLSGMTSMWARTSALRRWRDVATGFDFGARCASPRITRQCLEVPRPWSSRGRKARTGLRKLAHLKPSL